MIGHPFADGSAVVVERSLNATTARLKGDGDAYLTTIGAVVKGWPRLERAMLGPFRLPQHPFALFANPSAERSAMSPNRASAFEDERTSAVVAGISCSPAPPICVVAQRADQGAETEPHRPVRVKLQPVAEVVLGSGSPSQRLTTGSSAPVRRSGRSSNAMKSDCGYGDAVSSMNGRSEPRGREDCWHVWAGDRRYTQRRASHGGCAAKHSPMMQDIEAGAYRRVDPGANRHGGPTRLSRRIGHDATLVVDRER